MLSATICYHFYKKIFWTEQIFLKTRSLKCAFLRYLKLFGTAENCFGNKVYKACFLTLPKLLHFLTKRRRREEGGVRKEEHLTRTVNHRKWCIMTVFGTIWNCSEQNENKDGKDTYADTIWNDIYRFNEENSTCFYLNKGRVR